MDRQTLRDWVHRFNEQGPDGLINAKSPGRPSKLSAEQKEELRLLVETGPDPEKDLVVRWRCVDLKRVLEERFAVDLSEVSLGRVLKQLGFSHISARPQHPAQDAEAIAAFKKNSPPMSQRHGHPRCLPSAWRKLINETGRIASITTRDWATVSQSF
jgi:transposase